MSRRLGLTLVLLMAAVPVQAQTDYAVAGRVLDAETGDGLGLASVAVWRVSARQGVEPSLTTGAVTQPDGTFRVPGLTRGRYYVVISFVGYESVTVDSLRLRPNTPIADLGTVSLLPDASSLGEVSVGAERERVEIQIDRNVYRVADDPLVQGGSMSDALETVPSVEVDVDGNVSLRGVSNVAILIDGRPAPVSREFLGVYLQSLPAATIEQIEVIPNPSAKYEPDGMGGVINIVLKDEAELGLNGALTLGGDTQMGANTTGLLSLGRGPLNLTATIGLRRNERDRAGDRFRINRAFDPITQLDQDDLNRSTRSSALVGLNADYRLNAKTRITSSAQLSARGSDQDEESLTLLLDAAGAPGLNTLSTTDGASAGWSGDLRLGVIHDFEGVSEEGEAPRRRRGRGDRGGGGRGGRGGGRGFGGGGTVSLGSHSLAADIRVNASDNEGDDLIREQLAGAGDLLRLQQTTDTSDRTNLSAQIDYARPVGETRIETGYRGTVQRSTSVFASETSMDGTTFTPDVELANTSTFDEQVHAAYLQLARQLGPLGVQAGVRGEIVRTTFDVSQGSFGKDYESLFPSASLAYELGERTVLRTSYSRRISRPRSRTLNPFPSVRDPLNVSVGNPDLRPEYTDSVELSAVRLTPWGTVSVTPYMRRTTDVVRRLQTLRDDGVTVSTFENFDTATSSGLEAVVSYQGESMRGFASLEGFRVITDGTSVDTDLENDAFGWGGRANTTFQLGDRLGVGRTDLQISARYRAPMDTEQGRIGARAFVDLALRQRLFNDRANLTIRARDPFGWATFDSLTDTPRLFQTLERDLARRQLALTFTYTFGESAETRLRRQRGGQGAGAGGDDGGDFEGLDY
ncbi:MAG: TonB-dependent receptor [Bacteroidota bacterium]